MDGGQKTPVDILILTPTWKIYVFWYLSQTDGLTDGRTEREINPVWAFLTMLLQVKWIHMQPNGISTRNTWISIIEFRIRGNQIGAIASPKPTVKIRVVYHDVTSSFFGIGILPVSDLTGRSVFWSVLLVWRELLFSAKGGLALSKGGWCPLFPSKRGHRPPFWGKKGFPPKNDTKMYVWYRPRFPSVSVW